MKSDKKQTVFMIGIVFLILAGIMLYVTLKAPHIYEGEDYSYSTAISTTKETLSVKYPMNINTASAQELAAVEGMSEENAKAIVAYRKENGAFSDVSEIMNIKGIGEKTYYNVAPYLDV